MSDYLFGRHHETLDRILVNNFGRPTREERYENRMHVARTGVHVTATTVPFIVGTGRVRAGSVAVKAGHRAVVRALPSRGFFSGWRHSEWTVHKTLMVKEGAEEIGRGLLLRKQGRMLQGLGAIGYMSGKWYA